MNQPRITIVTPCYNSERFLEETILSVLDQGWENLEYIIVDGGSTDGTVEIIRKYEEHLTAWISEPDNGMYDAINKGFAKGTGEIYAWINSDDIYLDGAFAVMGEAFQRHPKLDWLCGVTKYTNELSQAESNRPLLMFNQSDLASGYYGLCMHYVEQSCCFWRATLWGQFGPIPMKLKYAGDYWLWTQFAKGAALTSINFPIASFRKHAAQLSQDQSAYRREVLDCYGGTRWIVIFRQILRQISRRSDCDIRFMNWIRRFARYRWVDPSNGFIIQDTRRTRMPSARIK